MRNFVITLLILSVGIWVADNVSANTLYDLYSDYSNQKTIPVKQQTAKKQTVNTYNTNYANTFGSALQQTESISKQGSRNYGQYAYSDRRTNPVRIGNPYNYLNDKHITMPSQVKSTIPVYSGDAVTFKRSADGSIYGYNKNGKRVGVYRVNQNGTTSQYDIHGNNMGTVR